MITLYQFPPSLGLLNPSPFCMKVEVYLKLAKIPYQTFSIQNPAKAPKGKLPYIKDGDKTIADSGVIIDYLENHYGNRLDQHLTDSDKTQSLFIRRMLEEHFYWVGAYSRWIDKNGINTTLNSLFSQKRNFLIKFLAKKIQKYMKKNLYAQGLGRHNRDEIYQFGIDDLNALENFLHNKTFAFGHQPCSLDACIYAALANIFETGYINPLTERFGDSQIFRTYLDRMKHQLTLQETAGNITK